MTAKPMRPKSALGRGTGEPTLMPAKRALKSVTNPCQYKVAIKPREAMRGRDGIVEAVSSRTGLSRTIGVFKLKTT